MSSNDSSAIRPPNGQEGSLITVRVTPRAKQTAITEIASDAIRIRLQSPPVDGKANKTLLKALSNWLNVPGSTITLMKGEKSRIKQLHVAGLPPATTLERLTQQAHTTGGR
jgi:uncharacterized protein (TIGR00251 family)